jgi:hypothetical protein
MNLVIWVDAVGLRLGMGRALIAQWSSACVSAFSRTALLSGTGTVKLVLKRHALHDR